MMRRCGNNMLRLMIMRFIFERLAAARGKGGIPARSSSIMVPWIMERFQPKTMVDIGCGDGAWCRAFRERGCDATGIDNKPYGEVEWINSYIRINLAKQAPSLDKRDLVLCLEVLEHLPVDAGLQLVGVMCRTAPVVICGAGIPKQGGLGHVNEQWPSYWAEAFSKHGYYACDDLRSVFWGDIRIAPWYRQDTLIWTTEELAVRYKLTLATLLDVVHPDNWSHVGPMGIWKRITTCLK